MNADQNPFTTEDTETTEGNGLLCSCSIDPCNPDLSAVRFCLSDHARPVPAKPWITAITCDYGDSV